MLGINQLMEIARAFPLASPKEIMQMANYNNRGMYPKSNGRNGYYDREQYRGTFAGPQMAQKQFKKHSGAKMTQTKTGVRCIVAWNYSRRFGMVSLVAVQKHGGKASNGNTHVNECMTKSGQVREVWACKLSVPMQADRIVTGFFDPSSNKLRIPDLNMVASCSRNYFGRMISKNIR